MRLLNAFRFILRTQRPPVTPSFAHIFQPLITSSSAQLLEVDFNIHKSNSSYFSDLDISRTHLVCTLFAKGIEKMRGGTGAWTGSQDPQFGLALGAVSCNFRKEVLPYQQYEMWSRILTWDDKWLYIVTHFVARDAAKPRSYSLYSDGTGPIPCKMPPSSPSESAPNSFNAEKSLFATALSKCVFKSGRRTVSPGDMFGLSGLITPDVLGSKLKDIEMRRQSGLELAEVLATQAQKPLEQEFNVADGEALARHTDGTGINGVVSTLLQLAGLRRSQAL